MATDDLKPLDEGPLPPGFGKLGDTPEQHERSRIGELVASGRVDRAPVPQAPLARSDVREVKTLVREVLRDVGDAVAGLRTGIEENTRLLKHIDVPLENIADSHERAAHSFETLRGENEEMRSAILQLAGKVGESQRAIASLEALVGRIALRLDV